VYQFLVSLGIRGLLLDVSELVGVGILGEGACIRFGRFEKGVFVGVGGLVRAFSFEEA